MLFNGDKAYYPLICVGKNIEVSSGGRTETIPSICVSPSGRIAIVMSDPFSAGVSTDDFLATVSTCIQALRKWDCDVLDGVAADYFYETTGQAARGVDIMARNGYLEFTSNHNFFANVDEGLQLHHILVIVSVPGDELPMRSVEFSNGKLRDADILFSLVDCNICVSFG